MSLTRVLSGTVQQGAEIKLEQDGKSRVIKVNAGDPVLIVGVMNLLDKNSANLICLTADGVLFYATNTVVKITIDKELRERLAEATLSS